MNSNDIERKWKRRTWRRTRPVRSVRPRLIGLTLGGCLLSALLAAAPARTAEPPFTEATSLSDYVGYALRHNPELEAAFDRWQAAVARIAAARSLPDPRFSYAYYIEEVETRVGPQEHRIGLSQMLPWFGKLRLQGEVAAREADVLEQAFEAARLKLRYQVEEAYHDLVYLRHAIEITQGDIRLLTDLEGVAQTRFRAGAPLSGVVKIQVELGKLADQLRSLQARREPMNARLNAALNRAVDAPLPWPPDLAESPGQAVDAESLLAELQRENPELKALDRQVARERSAVHLARRQYYPDVTVGLDYISTGEADRPVSQSGKDPVIAMFSLNIPLWRGKLRSGVQEAEARQEAALERREHRRNALSSNLKMAVYRWADARRKVELYGKTLMPLAEKSFNVARQSWQAGEGDFLDMIDAQRVLLEFRLARQEARRNQAQRWAEIERLVGRSLPRLEESSNAEPGSAEKEKP